MGRRDGRGAVHREGGKGEKRGGGHRHHRVLELLQQVWISRTAIIQRAAVIAPPSHHRPAFCRIRKPTIGLDLS